MTRDGAVFYAIGDVHGERSKLAALHAMIRRHHAARHPDRPGVLVHLGDYVDRGPDSHGVVSDLIALSRDPWAGFSIVSLKGNHEEMLLLALDAPQGAKFEHWLENGGGATLASYAAASSLDTRTLSASDWPQLIDRDHVLWLCGLPTIFHERDRGYVFVHAGIDPKTFPREDEAIRLWTRAKLFFQTDAWPKRPELENIVVVHGHTPTDDSRPQIDGRRINLDSGATYGGPLSAVALAPGVMPVLLTAFDPIASGVAGAA